MCNPWEGIYTQAAVLCYVENGFLCLYKVNVLVRAVNQGFYVI